jgi:exodeoxyribonuclease III
VSLPDSQRIGCYDCQAAEFSAEELARLDCEGRCVITEHQIINASGKESLLVILNVYCPRAEPGNRERLEYKLRFYRLLQLRAESILDSGSHVIILGDINTSHKKIDHCSPDDHEEFFANPGRQWMDGFLCCIETSESSEHGCPAMANGVPLRFIDTYRWLHPTELNAFTNWCTLTGARATNYGCRLDYIIADIGLLPCLSASSIMAEVEGSDHCPVVTEFDCRIVTAAKCPPLCTKFMPQFVGRQQKLVAFFTKRTMDSQEPSPVAVDSEISHIISGRSDDKLTSSRQSETGSVALEWLGVPGDSDEAKSKDKQWTDPVLRLEEDYNLDCFERCSSVYLDLNVSPIVERASKRTASVAAKQVKSKKSKGGSSDSAAGIKQSNLLNFFNKPLVTSNLTSTAKMSTSVHSENSLIYSVQDSTAKAVDLNCAISCSFSGGVDKMPTQPEKLGLKPSMTVASPCPFSATAAASSPSAATSSCHLSVTSSSVARQTEPSAWKMLLKGPPQTPMCKGHGEPCVLRTVRKDGPNKGKQFWVCNRPEGHKNNPEARCDYFVWVSVKKL